MPDFCSDPLWVDIGNSSSIPNLTQCFQHTVLTFIPLAFLLVLLPALMMQAERISTRFASLPWTPAMILRMALSLYLVFNSIFILCFSLFSSSPTVLVDYLYPCLWALFFALHVFIDWNRRRCGQVSSGIQHLSLLVFLVCTAPEFRYRIEYQDPLPLFFSFMAFWPVVLLQVVLYCFADSRGPKMIPSPELDSSFMNRLTFWWFTALPLRGAKHTLVMEDLFELNYGSTAEHLGRLFEKYWAPKLTKHNEDVCAWKSAGSKGKPPPAPSLVYSLFQMFKFDFLTASALKVFSDTMQFANPFLLNELIGFVSDPNAPLWQGLGYAILMFLASEVRSLIINVYFYIMFRMGIKIQTALTSAVYAKAMKLSNGARRKKTVGEIVNLMAIDVDFFQMITPQIQQFWSCPYQIVFCLVYLFITLGYSACPGIVIMALFVPINIVGSIMMKRWQARMQQMKLKDERTKMVNEVLNGMKVIKLYAWEEPMEAHIASIRNRELELVKKASVIKTFIDTFNTTSPFLVAASSFGTFILSSDSHILTPQIAFVSLTLFNQLRSPMTMVGLLINMLIQAMVSNRRLKSFFVSEELDLTCVERSDRDPDGADAVEIVDLVATWDDGSEKSEKREDGEKKQRTTLEDINIKVKQGGLLAVVGTVGSGKSSLLSSLLGELTRLSGRIVVRGSVAYVPQQAWIQNMSVRDNILFGKPYNKALYEQVIFACALKPDLAILPHEDKTEIGEKGINLSGGQKARISLARAVYQQYDVYLLDDPLSAVDAHVGRHIFNHVIGPNGLIAGKTRILVTHGLTFTKDADEIAVFHDGRIIEKGSYDHLIGLSGKFTRLVEEYSKKSANEEEEDGESIESEEFKVSVSSGKESPSATTAIEKEEEEKEGEEDEKKLIEKEGVETGRVSFSVYLEYMRKAGSLRFLGFTVCFILFQAFQMARSFWLSAWSNENNPEVPVEDRMNQDLRLIIYIALGSIETTWFFISLVFLVVAGINASRNLHSPLIHNLMRSPIAFYDTTPIGRILNRCSKDIDTIDSQLPMNFRYFVYCILQATFTILAISISTPLFIVVIIPLTAIYLFFLRFYVPTSRQLKRMESINRSPIYSHFGESIQGAASIRAYGKMTEFCLSSEGKVDTFVRCRFLSVVANRWLAVRLEFIGNSVIFFAALFATLSKEFGWGATAGIVGVSISYALNITEVLNFAVRQVSEIESNIVSVERVKEYTETPNEAEWVLEDHQPKKGWPDKGGVVIDNYSTRYRPGLDLVLKNITAQVHSGEKIGIVGRTGAGKSSFALALFRMVEPAGGKIVIDGEDTVELGLHDLRRNITIIPQDPVLFSGTLRFNLDPFGEYDDAALWKALELAHLQNFTSTLSAGLDHLIAEGGDNISVGQRQLVCLARATLRNSQILVLDEATAAVDLHTDALIQGTIRTYFKHCTVFTIAHRLNTILDYDRIMVLEQGEIAEMDTPSALMANRDSLFSKMLADAATEHNS